MARDADQTRKRLLEAAAAEFAAFGIAGARVDRIAEAAGCNKAMIYAYFGNKDQLFDAVFTALVAATIEHVPFDAEDLPGYAGRLFDRYEDDLATVRLATWYRLERPHGAPLQAIVASNTTKLEKVARAQRDGVVPDRYSPAEILTLVIATAGAWASVTPELGKNAPADRARRRWTVVDAVRRLLAEEAAAST
ncbi:TetR family transcriptional regulator [Planotetraspora kaengkrachanensis]|uniref:Putative TetR family regulatory protein n=1 Tax=Planotetraspora kaengkrachanensis TaxID=575193 RepID=A0A8J3V9R1_9ACTN|nr:TetR family transcriptional regulator [Planotetraspora kaengkrachanensis]GIG82738.1 putative TetR family regulatory protein [Planotetraspora kaengkrachanensis]